MTEDFSKDAACAAAADALLERLPNARAVVVATEDGLLVASAMQVTLDASRLSAITSSMSAIGEVVSAETGIGQVRCLMIEADDGYLVMRSTRRRGVGLVIAVLVGRGTLLGLAINGAAEMARGLAE